MKDQALTRRQVETLDFLARARDAAGYSPTLREIADGLGLSSVATVAEHLDALEAFRLIRRERDRARSVLLTSRGRSLLSSRVAAHGAGVTTIPLMGTIAAGEPVEALAVEEEIEVPAGMAAGRRCYALRVRGESMTGEGIFDGDIVVVEEKPVAENGETVVALLGGSDVTLKKFYRERVRGAERIRLQPANPSLEPIILGRDDRVEVQGRVRGVLRLL